MTRVADGGGYGQLAGFQELQQEGGVVDDGYVEAEGLVLVAERVQHVGVGGDDAVERVTAQRGDVARCQILECGLVAEAPGDVAAVQFLRTQDREVDPGPAQQQDQGAERALGAQVEGAVAEPEQHVALALVGQHGEAQVDGPVEAAGERAATGVVGCLEFLQHSGGFAGGGAEFERLETAEVDHGIDVLDHHRAFLHAGAAGGAGPEGIRVDHGADDGLDGAAMGEAERASGMAVAGVGAVVGSVFQGRSPDPGSASSG